jgi:hypothetical protein
MPSPPAILPHLRCALLAGLSLAIACAGDDDSVGVGRGRDRSMEDGGGAGTAARDGSTSAGRDAGGLVDGGFITLPDGRVVPIDGGHGDDEDAGTDSEIDPMRCTISEQDDLEVAVPVFEGSFAIAPGRLDFGLSYYRNGSYKHALETAYVDSAGAALAPETLIDDYNTITGVALAGGPDGWWLAWTDNSRSGDLPAMGSAPTIELHAARLDESLRLTLSSPPRRITQSSARERRPTVAYLAGRPTVAWIAEESTQSAILAKRLDDESAIVEWIAAADGHRPIQLALAAVGAEHGAVAWVDEVTSRGIWLRRIGPAGQPLGDPLVMTPFAAPGSTVDLATHATEGGAVVYSVGIDNANFDVRFRRLDRDGSFRGNELKVISRPQQAKDAGIARLGGGYVIAYRAIPDDGLIRDPQIRVVFVSKEGNVSRDRAGRVATFHVVPAARDGSRVQVKVSVDGQLLIAFVDGNASGDHKLRLLRRRLDCGL